MDGAAGADQRVAVSEADFQRAVMETARWYGWRATHFRPVQIRPGRWATPLQGDAGFVDLVLARGGVVLHVELKAEGKYPTSEQRVWGAALGESYRLWRPSMMPQIIEELRSNHDRTERP